MSDLSVTRLPGRPSELLDRADAAEFAGVRIERFEPDVGALVLGSRQRSSDTVIVDHDRCRRAGIEVAARRSGGGVVLVLPGEILWIDIVVAPDDPRFEHDVIAAMLVTGKWWAQALVACGVDPGRLAVNERGECQTQWSRFICFAGLGPGEVTLDGRKLLGISQRRTRLGARLQCAVHLEYDPAALPTLLANPRIRSDELPSVATLGDLGADPRGVAEALVDAVVEVVDLAR